MGHTDLESKLSFFLYGSKLTELQNSPQKKVYIYGGRGVGKSEFLKEATKRFGSNKDFYLIYGRDCENTLKQLDELDKKTSEGKSPILLFDDLDYFWSFIYNEKEDFKKIISTLDSIFNRLVRQKTLVIASGILSPMRMLELEQNIYDKETISSLELKPLFWSIIISRFEYNNLIPWGLNWRASLKNFIESQFSSKLEPEIFKVWQDVIIELTGGHPFLLEKALSELDQILKKKKLVPIEERLITSQSIDDLSHLRSLICRHLEDCLVRTSLNVIGRTINNVKSSNKESFDYLKRLALGEKVVPPYNIRSILTDEALVYQDQKNGDYQIPGEFICKEILRSPDTIPKSLELRIHPDTLEPNNRGKLIAKFGTENIEIHLVGGQWNILKILFEKNGEVISFDELKELTRLATDYAIRSAIQRLEKKLRDERLKGIIENVRGKGYRLGKQPVMINNSEMK